MVYCHKLKKEAPALTKPPLPGALGQEIFEKISQEAWRMWLVEQTMLINEMRLNLLDPDARSFLQTQMQKFLFEDSYTRPTGYIPPKS